MRDEMGLAVLRSLEKGRNIPTLSLQKAQGQGWGNLCPNLSTLRARQGTVLEVVLENAGGERRGQGCPLGLDGAHDFSPADDFGGGKSGNFCGKNEIDFQLNAGLQQFVGLKEHSRPADVFGGAFVPAFFSETAITQRQMELEALCARRRILAGLSGMMGFCGLRIHGSLRGSWSCIEHFAHHIFEVAKVKGLLKQANADIQRAVVSDDVLGVAGHVKDFYVGANFRDALG